MKRNESLLHATTWVNLDLLNSQRQEEIRTEGFRGLEREDQGLSVEWGQTFCLGR